MCVQVSRAEGHLLQAQRLLKEGRQADASTALMELYALLPHRETAPPVPTARHLSLKLDLCQVTHTQIYTSRHTRTSYHIYYLLFFY